MYGAWIVCTGNCGTNDAGQNVAGENQPKCSNGYFTVLLNALSQALKLAFCCCFSVFFWFVCFYTGNRL